MFNLFLIFKRKFLPFLKNFNEEVSSNNKTGFAAMVAVVQNPPYVVSHYASHHLRENVQSSAIEKNMHSTKKKTSIIYMVLDQKYFFLQMTYWEGQVDYYC